jgi:hypothetical protein
MDNQKRFNVIAAPLRTAVAGLLASGLLLPAVAHASPVLPNTGILVGHVTCGPSEETSAKHATVAVDGIDLSTHTDGTGSFMLIGVPAGRSLTIDAVDASTTVSRYNVVVNAGETLDIGGLDLPACPQPAGDVDELPQDPQQVQDARD